MFRGRTQSRTRAQFTLALTLALACLATAAGAADAPPGASRLRRPLTATQLEAAPHARIATEADSTAAAAPTAETSSIEPREPNCAFEKSGTNELSGIATARRPMVERAPIEVAAKPRGEQPNHASVLRDLSAHEPFDVSSSGRYMVAVDSAGGLVLIDAIKASRLHPLQNSKRGYSLVEISGDARWIAAVRRDNPDEIDLWRADNGRFLRTITSEGGPKKSLDFDAETGELRVADRRGNGQTYSVPAGVLTGMFQLSNGMAAVKPPSASISIGPQSEPAVKKDAPQPSATAASPRPRVGGSRVGGPRPNPIRDTPPTVISEPAANPEPVATAAPEAAAPCGVSTGATSQKHLAEIVAPETARMMAGPMAAPMMAQPMMAEPMMSMSDDDGDQPYEPFAASAPPEPTPATAPAPTAPLTTARVRVSAPASAPVATAPAPAATDFPSNPFGAMADMQPAPSPGSVAPGSVAPGSAAPDEIEGATSDSFAASAPAGGAAASEPEGIAALAAEKTPPKPEEDLASITVHYATNRQRLTPEDRAFAVYFKGFFFSLPAVILYALILLALIAFPMLGRRAWAAAAVITGVLLLVSMAGFEAWVRSELRDELSGELYGSVPTNLNYGKCKISVPKPENRSPGELNRPLSMWVLQAPENAEKHFTLQKVTEHNDKDEFYASLSEQLAGSDDGTSLLFIHGYNVSFEDAVFRTAQLAVDLKFRGAPISFSWPSYADPVKYTFDEQNAEVSIPALRELLEDLTTRSGAKRIHIVAHSMGNRVLAGALRSMSPEARVKNKEMFREIVLAAPDIDSRVFQSQVLPHIQDNTQHCTLYASSHDRALMMSRYFHNYQRLGETEPQLIVASGMDTIDASMVDTSLLGHSYIGDVQSIVSDLHELVVVGKRPTERLWLEAELLGELMYWAIRPGTQTASEAKTNR